MHIIRNTSLLPALALTGVLFGASPAPAEGHRGYEGPQYSVEHRAEAYELRSYPPHLVAEVTVAGPRSRAANAGFRKLAGYIFGGNSADRKIAMTSPVVQAPDASAGTEGWTIRFAMPGAYALDQLPEPDDSAIRLLEAPAQRTVSVRFSGRWTDRNLEGREQALRSWAVQQGLRVRGEPVYAFYDSPFTLPMNRRNEIALRVE